MKNEYYNLKRIDKLHCIYNVIFGQRSNGKTFSVCEKGLRKYCEMGERMAYIRRFDEEITPKNIQSLFKPHDIKKLTNGAYDSTIYKNRSFYLYNTKTEETDAVSFCQTFALNTWERTKGADNGYFTIILFDEFITRTIYLNNEFVVFCNLLSSLLRDRDGTSIYMIANTVSKYCPYFQEMGLTKISDMKKGDIKVYSYGDSGLTVAVQYADEKGKTTRVQKYFAFDNPQLQMITNGDWEFKNYPHLNIRTTNKNIRLRFFVNFNDEIIAGDLMVINSKAFILFHPQTKDVNFNKYIVYQNTIDLNPLHCQNIAEGITDAHKLIFSIIKTNSLFYSDNTTGETVRSWLQTQLTNGLSKIALT